MTDLFNQENKGACFSSCGKYRYYLWRKWDLEKPFIAFVGLNPSTANQTDDDPTIRRVKRFAFDWGYGGIYMLNLFAFVTPYPAELITCGDPIAENNEKLLEIAALANEVVYCWGNFNVIGRDIEVVRLLRYTAGVKGYCLGKNANGSPKHPLYLKADTKLEEY